MKTFFTRQHMTWLQTRIPVIYVRASLSENVEENISVWKTMVLQNSKTIKYHKKEHDF